MDIFLLGVATEYQLEFWSRDRFADHMKNVVAHDAFRCRKIADSHLDNPAIHLGDKAARIPPMLAILLHLDVFWLPMVRLHLFVDVVGPCVF